MPKAATMSELDILADVISPDRGDLSAEVAESVLRWKFSDRAIARMNKLARKNQTGKLTQPEREELEKVLRVGDLVNLVQAKARLSLCRRTSA
jgi:hypothetical protein